MERLQLSNNMSDTSAVGMKKTTKKNQTKKKKLQYNVRDISNQLRRTKKIRDTSEVMVRARAKVADLQRSLYSGQFDNNEVRAALIHARKMVNCAQMKLRHIREEEQFQKSAKKKKTAGNHQSGQKIKRKIAQKKQELKAEIAMEQTKQQQRETARAVELRRKKQMHRLTERSKLNEADMEYESRKANSQGTGSPAYQMELSRSARHIRDLQREAYALEELERQEMESSSGDGISESDSNVSDMGMEEISAESTSGADMSVDVGADVSANVDVLV